jgi:TRAP-type mannitol/chloroaromatic compound transport system permease large subunit
MSYEAIAILMFSMMMLMLLTGQRVFGAIGFIAVVSAFFLWGDRGGYDLGFAAAIKLMKWYPLLTLPMFIFMGYVLSESKIADDLYKMFHVWMGGLSGGLAVGTIGLMVLISAMNGLSVAGMAIGATIALPELLKRGYDKRMVTGVIQAGSSLGILVPPSVSFICYDCSATSRTIMVSGHSARFNHGSNVHSLYRCAVSNFPISRARAASRRKDDGH